MKPGGAVVGAAHLDGTVGEEGGRGDGVSSSRPRAADLAASTSGWSKGLMPSRRPATAVANSHTIIWAPRSPAMVTRSREVRRRRLRPPDAPPGRRRHPLVTSGELGSATTGRTPVPSLPVDSAMSCSAQSAKPTMPEPSSTMTILLRSGEVPPKAAAKAQPNVVGVVLAQELPSTRPNPAVPARQHRQGPTEPAQKQSVRSSARPRGDRR